MSFAGEVEAEVEQRLHGAASAERSTDMHTQTETEPEHDLGDAAVQDALATLADVQQLLLLQQNELGVLRARLSHKQETFDPTSTTTCDRATRMDSSRLRYECAGLHEKATRTLFTLDTVESHGDAGVRKTRKGLSVQLNALADEAELLASKASDHLATLESLPPAEDDATTTTTSPSSASQTDDDHDLRGMDDDEHEDDEVELAPNGLPVGEEEDDEEDEHEHEHEEEVHIEIDNDNSHDQRQVGSSHVQRCPLLAGW